MIKTIRIKIIKNMYEHGKKFGRPIGSYVDGYIEIDLNDLSEYHKVLFNVIEQSSGGDWDGSGMEVLEKLRDQIFAILNDVGDY